METERTQLSLQFALLTNVVSFVSLIIAGRFLMAPTSVKRYMSLLMREGSTAGFIWRVPVMLVFTLFTTLST